jgi:hypothetical protein
MIHAKFQIHCFAEPSDGARLKKDSRNKVQEIRSQKLKTLDDSHIIRSGGSRRFCWELFIC